MCDMQNHSDNIDLWLRLIRADGVGPVLFHRLLTYFGSVDRALGASAHQLTQIEGIGSSKAHRIIRSIPETDIQRELAWAQQLGVHLIHLDDERYPHPLKRIFDPPPVLYVKGRLVRENNLCIAIVGSRHCSLYGREQAARFAHLLAHAGFTVVSGMARGIDTAAHQGALAAGGHTLAIQGCGLATCYPPENKQLFHHLAESGACISELPLNAEPRHEHFPARNRIIAGLSLGTLVIEAGMRSGAMITARLAMENNREVLALPGRIDSSLSKGPHTLLKQGAALVESIEDIMESLGVIGKQLRDHVRASIEEIPQNQAKKRSIVQLHLSLTEQAIYDCLGRDPLHADSIATTTHLPAGKITAELVSLQLKGMVKALPGNLFVRHT